MKKLIVAMGIVLIISAMFAGCGNASDDRTARYEEVLRANLTIKGYDISRVDIDELKVSEDGDVHATYYAYDNGELVCSGYTNVTEIIERNS